MKKKKLIFEQKELENQVINSFCKLYVQSKILLQESRVIIFYSSKFYISRMIYQEIETLKDYLMGKYDEAKSSISQLKNQIEDLNEAFQAEKRV